MAILVGTPAVTTSPVGFTALVTTSGPCVVLLRTLKVGTAGWTTWLPVVADASFQALVEASGLVSGAQYYFRVALDGLTQSYIGHATVGDQYYPPNNGTYLPQATRWYEDQVLGTLHPRDEVCRDEWGRLRRSDDTDDEGRDELSMPSPPDQEPPSLVD